MQIDSPIVIAGLSCNTGISELKIVIYRVDVGNP
jgi:hypothetical protein